MMWFKHNLNKRSHGNVFDFNIEFFGQSFECLSFKEACIRRAKQIGKEYKRLYLSYSGGMDSEFVLSVFIEAGIPIIPVAISTSFNQEELSWAKKYSSSNGISLTIIDIPDKEFIEKAYYKTYDKGLYSLLGAVPDIVHDYYGGVVITGNPTFFDLYNPKIMEIAEYEFYEFNGNVINFFCDLPIMYSMAIETDISVSTQQAKSKLYNLKYRDKLKYSEKFYAIHNRLRPFDFNYKKVMYTNDFIKIFSPVNMLDGKC